MTRTAHHQTLQRNTSQHNTSWRSATDATLPGQKDQVRTRIAMTTAVHFVEEQRGRHRRVEHSAMRDPATAIGGCRTRPLTLGFGSARLEGAARPPRGAGDALAWCRCNNAEGSNAAVPDAVLEVYLEHLLIMTKDELRVNNPMSCLTTTKSVDSEFQCMYKLGGAVQAIIPEFPSPEIGHETTRNLKRTMQDRVVTMNRMQQSSR